MNFFQKLKEDKKNYQRSNTDEKKVIDAHYFSSYKNTLVVKKGGNSGAYLFVIWLGRKVKDENLVKHEYGHKKQRENLGFFGYFKKVCIPSFLCFKLRVKKKLPYNYYSLPWEFEADSLGGVIRKNVKQIENKGQFSVKNILKLFKNR